MSNERQEYLSILTALIITEKEIPLTHITDKHYGNYLYVADEIYQQFCERFPVPQPEETRHCDNCCVGYDDIELHHKTCSGVSDINPEDEQRGFYQDTVTRPNVSYKDHEAWLRFKEGLKK